jgi:hypothetical protein
MARRAPLTAGETENSGPLGRAPDVLPNLTFSAFTQALADLIFSHRSNVPTEDRFRRLP